MDSTQTYFNRLFSAGSFENLSYISDSNLKTEDGFVFNVHRVILARNNRYFRELFCGRKIMQHFLVPGIRGEILDLVLTYIYNGTIHLTQSNVCELLVASENFLVDGLASRIKKYFTESNMSLDNCISLYMIALKINHEDIVRLSYRFIQTHFGAIVDHQASKIGELSFDNMKRFLEDKNLCVESEREAWSGISKWVEHDASGRLRCVPELIQCLKVSDMEESLAMEILFSDIVAENPFCKDLHRIKSEDEFVSSLAVLIEYHSKISIAPSDFHIHRRPECMHVISRHVIGNNFVEVFLTYDENLDLWRKLGEFEFDAPKHFVAIDDNVYMFGDTNIVFSLVNKQWRKMPDFLTRRESYHVLKLRNMIYVIEGKYSQDWQNVEFYNPELGRWFQAKPMFPVLSCSAVSFQDRIFVVGKLPEDSAELGMMAQVYNPESDSWTMFPAPNVFRSNFALAGYHRKLYIIGGIWMYDTGWRRLLKNVEVFDFDTRGPQRWQSGAVLPHAYECPEVVVLNDKLIVYDNCWRDLNYYREHPPVSWNEADARWEALDDSLPLRDLQQYMFCTIDDNERMAPILRENRYPANQFEKSPFV